MKKNIVSDEVVNYIRSVEPDFSEGVKTVQVEALEQGVPIIPHETAHFLKTMLSIKRPKNILEIGTAVGFSASLFCEYSDAHITTVDRYEYMIERAKINFEKLGMNDRITFIEGDAAKILPHLSEQFDFIFIDAAKGQYLNFLPHCLALLTDDGIMIADNVLQNGSIAEERENIPRRQRTIHTRMRMFLWEVTHNDNLVSSIVPIGDGLVVCHKCSS